MTKYKRNAPVPDDVDPATDPIDCRFYFSDAAAEPPNALRVAFRAPGDKPGETVQLSVLASDVFTDAGAVEADIRAAFAIVLATDQKYTTA